MQTAENARHSPDGRRTISPGFEPNRKTLPLFGLTCLVINWVVGIWLHPRERLLARLLWLGGAIVQVVLLMGVLRLVA